MRRQQPSLELGLRVETMPKVKPGTPAPKAIEPKRQQWEHQQHEGRQFPVQMGADGWEIVKLTGPASEHEDRTWLQAVGAGDFSDDTVTAAGQ